MNVKKVFLSEGEDYAALKREFHDEKMMMAAVTTILPWADAWQWVMRPVPDILLAPGRKTHHRPGINKYQN